MKIKINRKTYETETDFYLPKDFHKAVRMLERPYIKITERDYKKLMDFTECDAVRGSDGRLYTFGNCELGYALMPIAKEEVAA